MNKTAKIVLFAVLALTLVTSAEAGNYTKQNVSLYLDGKVLIRFDQLLLAWNRDQTAIDRIKYEISCEKGKIVLNNVVYLDRAGGSPKDNVRWSLAPFALNQDISAKLHHPLSFIRSTRVNIKPFDLDTAQVQFLFHASGRDCKVIWFPKTGELFGTW